MIPTAVNNKKHTLASSHLPIIAQESETQKKMGGGDIFSRLIYQLLQFELTCFLWSNMESEPKIAMNKWVVDHISKCVGGKCVQLWHHSCFSYKKNHVLWQTIISQIKGIKDERKEKHVSNRIQQYRPDARHIKIPYPTKDFKKWNLYHKCLNSRCLNTKHFCWKTKKGDVVQCCSKSHFYPWSWKPPCLFWALPCDLWSPIGH